MYVQHTIQIDSLRLLSTMLIYMYIICTYSMYGILSLLSSKKHCYEARCYLTLIQRRLETPQPVVCRSILSLIQEVHIAPAWGRAHQYKSEYCMDVGRHADMYK